MALDDFTFDGDHGVVVCRECATCIVPDGPHKWKHHLRREPHRMGGKRLLKTIDLISSYELRGRDELRRRRPDRRAPCKRIPRLATYRGYICLCDTQTCDFVTRRPEAMYGHMPRHGKTASQHDPDGRRLWGSCVLQTYFTAKGMIDYFVVQEDERGCGSARAATTARLQGEYQGPRPCSAERQLLHELRADLKQAARDAEEKAAKVEDVGEGRGDRKRWLVQLGFASHLHGLRDSEIRASFKLPKKRHVLAQVKADGPEEPHREGQDDEDKELRTILGAVDILLRKGYDLVADRSLGRKMTRQRAQQLSDFASGSGKKGKDIAFRCFKNESTLTSYFRKMKELLVYYYRVVYTADGHFTREAEGQTLPRDIIDQSHEQRRAMDEMFAALQGSAGDDHADNTSSGSDTSGIGSGGIAGSENPKLEGAIRKFYMRLICHHVGSALFRSPVLSFCAMLSRTSAYGGKVGVGSCPTGKGKRTTGGEEMDDDAASRRRRLGGWHEPGNYSGHLSALIWTAQLLMFETVCFRHRDDERQIPATLGTLCEKYMHQKQETSFGHILQWRLYLSSVARSAISRKQARWSWDGLEITYLSTSLLMGHVSQLVVSEYKHARDLLFNELLFGARDAATLDIAALSDDLDAEDCGGSWLTDKRNEEALRGSSHALLDQIERRAELRKIFVREEGQGRETGSQNTLRRKLDSRATALYEVNVQEFLKALLTLLHVAPMPPLRAPEILTVTFANSGSRRRSIMVWERMVMLHVCYRKSQEQTDKDGDNVRFVPAAIAELLMLFLAAVQPLRLLFLRQAVPGGLLSPYLFSKLDGTVWPDEAVSKCLSRACTRAQVPEFKVAWWRQAAASITKEKFSAAERANFNMEEIDAPEATEEEDLLVDLAEGSNHSFRTFNYAYAGSTTLTMNTLLHRAFRASCSWRTFFRVDELLAEEEARWRITTKSSPATAGPLSAYRKVKPRTRPLLREKELERAARDLHNDPTLRLRRPGQRDAMMATMGPGAAEQVVVVLSTGSGKTLIVMVGAALEGAGTTILVLPTVALRSNMLERLTNVGLKWIVWSPGETRPAPLVIVPAETACKVSFLEYAHKLEKGNLLDRIVVDECHLTLTALFRKSMRKLGFFVRQVRTQTVWLTATLPPTMEAGFIKHNMLLRPRIVRESTNRANIRYSIQRHKGPVGLAKRTAELARTLEATIQQAAAGRTHLPGGEKARIIVYCQTIDMMLEIAEELGCPMYTGDQGVMSEEDKEDAVQRWLGASGSSVLVATSAFSVGFDYPYVRWVLHAGAPRRMSDLAQESGRAGRDGMPSESIIIISDTWQPYSAGRWPNDADEESMLLYLTGQYCCRAVMSQYLDGREDWRWCMKDEDELCMVCPAHHTTKRPFDMELKLPAPAGEDKDLDMEAEDGSHGAAREETLGAGAQMEYTGPQTVRQQRMIDDDLIERFVLDLRAMSGCCLLCRIKDKSRPFDHAPDTCSQRWGWQKAKSRVLAACRKEGGRWMADYTACFFCFLPQTICSRADTAASAVGVEGKGSCEFRDMLLPLCFGAFYAVGPRTLIRKYSGRHFRDEGDYMRWLGDSTTFAGELCTHMTRLAALLLAEYINTG